MTQSKQPRRRLWRRLRERLGGVNWWRTLLEFAQITLGAVVLALAYDLFFVPNNVVPGGISGLAIVLRELFGWPVGLVTLLLNVPLFLAGLRWSGGMTTGVRTVYAVAIFSAALDLLPVPLEPVTDNPLLYVAYGGLMSGAGVALIFLAQGTAGGTGIIGRLLPRVTGLSVSQSIFIADALVIVAAAFVFGLEPAMYGVMVTAVSAWSLDIVLSGGRRARQALIISDEWQAVRDILLADLRRGVTILTGQGGYTGRQRTMLMCIINRTEAARLRHLVRTVDPAAFVVVSPTTEVWGEGFGSIHGEI